MLRCGLLGETLGHSYSPMIHHELGEYDYRLFEVSKEDLDAFLCSDRWDGLNVTIPYKKAVVPYCAELSEAAERLQSVNTLVRRPDGTLYGDNTDLFGFLYMVRSSGIDPAGKKALVLGSGGASVTVKAALEQLGADVTVISRSGPDDYDHLDRHADAQIIANTTPVGMYPHNGAAAVDLRRFPRCEGVLDIVYNPARTALLLQAEELGIPHAGGLSMLVAQAKRSSEQFTGTVIGDEALERVERIVNQRLRNIILIGMPGSGKSAVAAALGKALGREVVEADELISQRAGMSIPEIFARSGEETFRKLETEVLAEQGKRVLLCDFDPQANSTSGMGVDKTVSKGIYEVLVSDVPAADAVVHTRYGDVLPSNKALAGAGIELIGMDRREFLLKDALDQLAAEYDFIFIDCPPSLELLTLNALCAADSILVPVQGEYFALEGLSDLMNTVRIVRRSLNPKLALEGVLLTMFDGRTNLAMQVAEEVKHYFPGKVYATVIPRNVRLSEAPSHGKPITAYDRTSRGAEAYQALAVEFLKKQ